MSWEESAMALIISLTGANTLFLWSLHEKVTKLEADYTTLKEWVHAIYKIQESCGYCQKRLITATRV